MRDGTTRPTPHTTWMPPGIQVAHWRRHSRLFDLRALAEGASGLVLARRLLAALLEELHVSDDFDTLVGPLAGLPTSEYPRLLAIAVLLRHSWSPQDLACTAAKLGLPGPNAAASEHPNLNTNTAGDRGRRRRVPRGARRSQPRTHTR
jgi:hypothetical protein